MKILQKNEGALLNAQVLNLLKQKGADNLDVLQTGERPTSEKEVFQYLAKYCPAELDTQNLVELIQMLKAYELQKKEVIQLLNYVLGQEVEVYLKVEDCETRLGEEKITELFNLLTEKLKANPLDEEEAAQDVEMEQATDGNEEQQDVEMKS
eukprot:TRINITY_DN75691_c0_g1_i7.p2 TRINITY_DN75691_c0_g1~~TRINITY_DN75691_c0_g1_i7.p2  ORF type:complete len:152 (-),score=33.21 TRINITY_DN75691_c0_g1_i7:250-705(-)